MTELKKQPNYQKRKAKRQRLKEDFEYYAPNCLFIKPKKGGLVPFRLNRAQRRLHELAQKQLKETGMIRVLVLKGRQQGISTYIEGRFYWRTSHRKGVQTYILTHEDKATQNLFSMVSRYHEHCPKVMRPVTGATNANALAFKTLDSGYAVGTAGAKGTGRSQTITFFHGSEVAFWPHADTHATGVLQAVPREPGTEVFNESTANGIGNYFHAQWQLAERGESDFVAVFLPWYWQDEYKIPLYDGFILTAEESKLLNLYGDDGLTPEHLHWRRIKTAELSAVGTGSDGEWKFRQEYPFTATEAFQTSGDDSLISAQICMASRRYEGQARGARIVGVDPSRFGKDPAAIAYRQGRICSEIKLIQKPSTMELAGICANILRNPKTGEDTKIDMMFIDVGGLGAGVYDRLEELGFKDQGRIQAINFGERATEKERFFNKRSEMWCDMNEWLNMGAKIPDLDWLQGELVGPKYTYDSSQRIKLEKKEDMIKRGLASPNGGDAVSLTFALPVMPGSVRKQYRQQPRAPIDRAVGY